MYVVEFESEWFKEREGCPFLIVPLREIIQSNNEEIMDTDTPVAGGWMLIGVFPTREETEDFLDIWIRAFLQRHPEQEEDFLAAVNWGKKEGEKGYFYK